MRHTWQSRSSLQESVTLTTNRVGQSPLRDVVTISHRLDHQTDHFRGVAKMVAQWEILPEILHSHQRKERIGLPDCSIIQSVQALLQSVFQAFQWRGSGDQLLAPYEIRSRIQAIRQRSSPISWRRWALCWVTTFIQNSRPMVHSESKA